MSAAFEIKGWCPGALRPMQSGDGLIVRVRPHGSALPVSALARLAEAASQFGNGQIDLTRRANLQIRGVSAQTLSPLWDVLAALDVLDDSPEHEAIRNIVVNPLTGLDPGESRDVRPLAQALERRLIAAPELQALPGKFAFALDGGGALPLTDLAADIRLVAVGQGDDAVISVGVPTADAVAWLGVVAPDRAADAALQLAGAILARSSTGRAHDLSQHQIGKLHRDLTLQRGPCPSDGARRSSRYGVLQLGADRCVVGIGAPFGRIDAASLTALAGEWQRLGIEEVRLSPWRTLYAAVASPADGERLLATARTLGLIVDEADPIVRIDACSGAGCCASTALKTRDHGRILADAAARAGFAGTLHVSGCAKGCARSAEADLVLVGDGDRYHVVRHGTVRGKPAAIVAADELTTKGEDLLRNHWTTHG